MNRLNPLNDFAFQKSLGEKGDEEQLAGFLNAALERTGKGSIESVEILESKDLPAEIVGGKMSKLDVLCKLTGGTRVNIEVQIKNQHNMGKRSLYYWSLKYTRDFNAGSDYSELMPVITINIVDFSYFPITDFHTSYHLWEDEHKDFMLTDACEVQFLDMVKFRQMKAGKVPCMSFDLVDPLHRWLAYFDEHSSPELIEEVLKMDGAIRKMQEKMDLIVRDPAMLRAYEQYEKAASDYTSGMNGARREGELIGEQRGQLRGERIGEQNKAMDIARSMKGEGDTNEKIARLTGLSLEEIARL
jgi:predicted transposase/invertase (TIGR01784 family)